MSLPPMKLLRRPQRAARVHPHSLAESEENRETLEQPSFQGAPAGSAAGVSDGSSYSDSQNELVQLPSYLSISSQRSQSFLGRSARGAKSALQAVVRLATYESSSTQLRRIIHQRQDEILEPFMGVVAPSPAALAAAGLIAPVVPQASGRNRGGTPSRQVQRRAQHPSFGQATPAWSALDEAEAWAALARIAAAKATSAAAAAGAGKNRTLRQDPLDADGLDNSMTELEAMLGLASM